MFHVKHHNRDRAPRLRNEPRFALGLITFHRRRAALHRQTESVAGRTPRHGHTPPSDPATLRQASREPCSADSRKHGIPPRRRPVTAPRSLSGATWSLFHVKQRRSQREIHHARAGHATGPVTTSRRGAPRAARANAGSQSGIAARTPQCRTRGVYTRTRSVSETSDSSSRRSPPATEPITHLRLRVRPAHRARDPRANSGYEVSMSSHAAPPCLDPPRRSSADGWYSLERSDQRHARRRAWRLTPPLPRSRATRQAMHLRAAVLTPRTRRTSVSRETGGSRFAICIDPSASAPLSNLTPPYGR